MRKLIWVSPFLAALFTVTSLYTANADRLDPGQMLVPGLFGCTVAGVFYLTAWLHSFTARYAPLVASMFTICFLIWHVSPAWVMGLLLAWLFCTISIKRIQVWADGAMVILPLILIVGIGSSTVQGTVRHLSQGNQNTAPTWILYKAGLPNVYFIVPDRMPSPLAMRESGLDPSSLVDGLTGLGFFVPDGMTSQDPYSPDYGGPIHTTRTMRFFASVLNGGKEVPLSISYHDARQLITQPRLITQLHNTGYGVTNVASWFNETAHIQADTTLRYAKASLLERLFYDELSVEYFNRTLLAGLNVRAWGSESSQKRIESGRHDWQAAELVRIASTGASNQFVISHIMLPHEPFIYSQADGRMEQYLDNIRYTLDYLLHLAYQIRASDPGAWVIIQADEGMAFRKPASLNRELSAAQWNGVFTAWYSPGNSIDFTTINKHTDILDAVVTDIDTHN